MIPTLKQFALWLQCSINVFFSMQPANAGTVYSVAAAYHPFFIQTQSTVSSEPFLWQMSINYDVVIVVLLYPVTVFTIETVCTPVMLYNSHRLVLFFFTFNSCFKEMRLEVPICPPVSLSGCRRPQRLAVGGSLCVC